MGAELRDHRRPPPGLARVQADVQRTVDAGEVRLSESSPSVTRFRRAGRGRVEVITFKPLSKNPGALHYCPSPVQRNARSLRDDFERQKKSRQRPTLPRSHPRSTIGGRGLNYRVRHGNGCFPSPMTTGKPKEPNPVHLTSVRPSRGIVISHPNGKIVKEPSADRGNIARALPSGIAGRFPRTPWLPHSRGPVRPAPLGRHQSDN